MPLKVLTFRDHNISWFIQRALSIRVGVEKELIYIMRKEFTVFARIR